LVRGKNAHIPQYQVLRTFSPAQLFRIFGFFLVCRASDL
jgi:hypothetical protein